MKKPLTLVRTSERSVYTMCRQRWAWHYIDGYESNYSSAALRFGDLTHQALAAYYIPGRKRGPLPAVTFQRLYKERLEDFNMRDEEQQWVDALDMGVAVLGHYIEKYGKDENIEVIAPEMPFKVRLEDIGGEPFWYVGRFDALIYYLDWQEYGIFEHKTATTISTRHLPLDEQAGSYWAFAPEWIRYLQSKGVLKKRNKLELDYILYNFLRKAIPDQRPVNAAGQHLNKDGSVSKVQPPDYFERTKVYRDEDSRRAVIKRVRQQAWEMRMVREGKLPIYKTPSTGYPDRHCETCPFYDMCELHESGSDWRSFAEATYRIQDPYSEYKADLFDKEGVHGS